MNNLKALLLTVQNAISIQVAAVQASLGTTIKISSGSVFYAFFQSCSAIALWVQWFIIQLMQAARLATSTGTDVDSFVGDFGLVREPAIAATGQCTLNRFITNSTVNIAVGGTIVTSDNSLTFQILPDTTNSAYNSATNTYTMAAGVSGINVFVQCMTAGTVGNIAANTLTLPGLSLQYASTCTNLSAFTNGEDAESDVALKARFVLFIAGLATACTSAIESAIAGVQTGLSYSIERNVDEAGNYCPGHFVVFVDDGSGYPSQTLKTNVQTAIQNVVSCCETFSVQSPNVVGVSIAFTFQASNKTSLISTLETAVTAYVNGLGEGVTLQYNYLPVVIYGVSPTTITGLSNITINGGTSDIVPSPSQSVKCSVVVAS